MKSMCLTTTFTVSVITLVILSCNEKSFVAGSEKIKPNEGTEYQFKLCGFNRPSEIDKLLSRYCHKKRKRVLTDQNILQSPEKARSFLRKSTITYVTNYKLFYEECCLEGCRAQEFLEHCVAY